jgi:hypothetical protein
VLIDLLEPRARLMARNFPENPVDAALLVSWSASFAAVAAGRLRKAGIPYIVDQGDPWGLGVDPGRIDGPFDRRRRRAEEKMWEGAAGGVLTTESQARAVREVVPRIPIMVRPSGHSPFDWHAFPGMVQRRRLPGPTLRLVHFGSLSPTRLEVGPILDQLWKSGIWKHITFTQFGGDWRLLPADPVGSVTVEARDVIPWEEAREIATEFDAAVVVGNRVSDGMRLPSKVFDYQTLPIPRIAFCASREDELFLDSSTRQAFLPVVVGRDDLATRVREHLGTEWHPEDLLPDREDSWEAVSSRVVDFFIECTGMAIPGPARDAQASGGRLG